MSEIIVQGDKIDTKQIVNELQELVNQMKELPND